MIADFEIFRAGGTCDSCTLSYHDPETIPDAEYGIAVSGELRILLCRACMDQMAVEMQRPPGAFPESRF